MSETATPQGELNFFGDGTGGGADGLVHWQQQRARALKRLARQSGLPLGHPVEVWLRGNVRLRGELKLREEKLFLIDDPEPKLELVVEGVPFSAADIESCVRTD